MKIKRYIAALLICSAGAWPCAAQRLVILHTNDTHSMIDPDDADGLGGVLRRKVVIDSVRAAEPHVLVVDAGDFVQGTLYFNLFRGEVEQKMMNELGYDIRILGNHEFDNGIDELADLLADSRAELLATNYDLSASPLARRFRPYTIREVGDRQVGFIAINLNPKGMISDGNWRGVVYNDAVKAANAAAWWLKHIDKVDAVVAVTHIGYDPSMPPGDRQLAGLSEDIDLIIGGHSHSLIQPSSDRSVVPNAKGRGIVVGQAGKSGKYVGKMDLDLDDMTVSYELIPVDSRLDSRTDRRLAAMLRPYRHGVDSLMARRIGRSAVAMEKGGAELLNFASDFIFDKGRSLAADVDFAIVNKGGLRRSLPKGDITEGMIITLWPFYNHLTVIDISGADLLEAFKVMARDGGNGVSANVKVIYDAATGECGSVTVGGRPLDLSRTYRVATIDYLANGGDYMESLRRGTVVARSEQVLYRDLIDEFERGSYRGRELRPSSSPRMIAR